MNNPFNQQPAVPSLIFIGSKQIGPNYWIGHCPDGVDYYAGQTFRSPAHGKLKTICLFPTVVTNDTEVHLSVFEFDQTTHTWKDKKAEVKTVVNKSTEGQWLDFALPQLRVQPGEDYAFKVWCNHDGIMAIAEGSWSTFDAYTDGEEWTGSSVRKDGHFHHDFDLAFEVEFEALT